MTESRDQAIENIAAAIEQNQRFLVATHVRPDGDAIGAVLAMTSILQRLQKQARPFCQDPVPPGQAFLPGTEKIRSRPDGIDHYQVAVLVDCGEYSRVGPNLANAIRPIPTIINIDHHVNRDPFGTFFWVDPKASSTCEMLYLLTQRLHLSLDPDLATQLYTGLLTDTGSFRFSNTSHRALEVASRLAAAGAEPAAIAQQVYESSTPQRLVLLAQVLNTVQFYRNDRLVVAELTQKMFNRSAASPTDSDGFIDLLRSVQSVQVAVLFRESHDGMVHVSLRSKGQSDVAAFARSYGGGGHHNAAAFHLQSELLLAKAEVIQKLTDYLS